MMENNEDDEAALVDSFFLPGGLFADEDDGNDDNNENKNKVFNESSRVSSNPWDDDNNIQSTTTRNMATTVITPDQSSMMSTKKHQDIEQSQSSFLQQQQQKEEQERFGAYSLFQTQLRQEEEEEYSNTIHNQQPKSNMAIRPPPGFHRSLIPDLSNESSHGDKKFLNSSLAQANNILQNTIVGSPRSSTGKSFGSKNAMNHKDLDVEYNIGQYNHQQQNCTIQRPTHGILSNPSNQHLQQTNNNFTTNLEKSTKQQQPLSVSDDDGGEILKEDYFQPHQINTTTTNDDDQNHIEYEQEEIDDIEDEDEEEDDDDDDDDDGRNIITIPMDICGNSGSESNTSSLSTSSDFDNSDVSSTASGVDRWKDGGVGYDTDQAHVSQIVEILDGSTERGGKDGKSASPAPSAVYSEEEIPLPLPGVQNQETKLMKNRDYPSIKSIWKGFIAFSLFIVQYPFQVLRQCFLSIKNSIGNSRRYSTIIQMATAISRYIKQIARSLKDYTEVFAALITKLLVAARRLLALITKALIITTAFLFQVWKYSLIEAVEESSVTICYLTFYFMPRLCSVLMEHVNLPHWTPHMLTLLGVFSLCNQVEAGTLHDDDVSIFRLSGTLTPAATESVNSAEGDANSSTDPRNRRQASHQKPKAQDQTVPRDERACRTILKILRFALPVFFLVDGFSSEFGSIMGVSNASRLTTAFMMSLVRKNLVSSPIAWVSWSVQVLVATYLPEWKLLDHIVLVFGLSSIRLIRYLDGQRERKRRR
jgi:hypothetical protein